MKSILLRAICISFFLGLISHSSIRFYDSISDDSNHLPKAIFKEKKSNHQFPVLQSENTFFEENEEEVHDENDLHVDFSFIDSTTFVWELKSINNKFTQRTFEIDSQHYPSFSSLFILYRNLRL